MREFQQFKRSSDPDKTFMEMIAREQWLKEQKIEDDFDDEFEEELKSSENDDPDGYHGRMRDFGYSQGEDGEWEHDDEFVESDY